MGCAANKAEDVEGCQHCVYMCNNCNQRVYACTSLKRCIHCNSSSEYFTRDNLRSSWGYRNGMRGRTMRNNVFMDSFSENRVLSSRERKEIDRCAWCYSYDSEMAKIALDAIEEAKKMKKLLEKESNKLKELEAQNKLKELEANNLKEQETKNIKELNKLKELKGLREFESNYLRMQLKNKTEELNKVKEREDYIIACQREEDARKIAEKEPSVSLPGEAQDPDKWRAPGGPKIVYVD